MVTKRYSRRQNIVECALSNKYKRYKRRFATDYFAFNYFDCLFVSPRDSYIFALINYCWKNRIVKSKFRATIAYFLRTCVLALLASLPPCQSEWKRKILVSMRTTLKNDQLPWKISSPKTFKTANFVAPTYRSYFTKFSFRWFSGGYKTVKYTLKPRKLHTGLHFSKAFLIDLHLTLKRGGRIILEGAYAESKNKI